MYNKEEFNQKVKEWLLTEQLVSIGKWEIYEAADDSVFITVSLRVELLEVKEITMSISTKNDEESIRIAVLSLYKRLIEEENSILDEMGKDAIAKLGV